MPRGFVSFERLKEKEPREAALWAKKGPREAALSFVASIASVDQNVIAFRSFLIALFSICRMRSAETL